MPEDGTRTNAAAPNFSSLSICCSPSSTLYFPSIETIPTFDDTFPIRVPIQERGPSPGTI